VEVDGAESGEAGGDYGEGEFDYCPEEDGGGVVGFVVEVDLERISYLEENHDSSERYGANGSTRQKHAHNSKPLSNW